VYQLLNLRRGRVADNPHQFHVDQRKIVLCHKQPP
jgi:hypothetical protein